MKLYTIPDEYEDIATLSAWLRTYPFMASNPAWLRGVPITDKCKALYPDIVATLQAESMPAVINLQNKKVNPMSTQHAISGNEIAA